MRKFLSEMKRLPAILRKQLRIVMPGAGPHAISIESLVDDTNGVSLDFYKNSATPAASDNIGQLNWYAKNSAGGKEPYAVFNVRILDPTDTTEDAKMMFELVNAGILNTVMSLGAGMWMEGATGGDPGTGKINATELQVQGSVVPFTKEFVSSGQTITSAGTATIAHSLGVIPKLVQIYLVCGTAENGYSIGDRVAMNPLNADATRAGVSITFDATNLVIRYGNSAGVFLMVHKTTGALVVATNANWTAVFSAWA